MTQLQHFTGIYRSRRTSAWRESASAAISGASHKHQPRLRCVLVRHLHLQPQDSSTRQRGGSAQLSHGITHIRQAQGSKALLPLWAGAARGHKLSRMLSHSLAEWALASLLQNQPCDLMNQRFTQQNLRCWPHCSCFNTPPLVAIMLSNEEVRKVIWLRFLKFSWWLKMKVRHLCGLNILDLFESRYLIPVNHKY